MLPTQGAAIDAEPAVRLAQLAAAVHDCRKCNLHRGRTQVVFGTGDPAAALVFVGEAPGHDEDVQGAVCRCGRPAAEPYHRCHRPEA